MLPPTLGKILPVTFFNRETELVARDLLGKVLQCTTDEGTTSGIIVETEAYIGEHDAASHAAVGKTERNSPLYGPPGHAYVYFIYGMYWSVNTVTRAEGLPSGVLIRAIEPLQGIELMHHRRPKVRNPRDLTNGPGKLCLALGITGSLNRTPLQRKPLVVRDYRDFRNDEVCRTPRIGIRKAADWPLRWIVKDNPYISKTPAHFPLIKCK